MKVVVKAPGEQPVEQDIVNGVREMQELVGGYFEAYRLGHLWLFCNEEGRLHGLPTNLISPSLGPILGTVVVGKADSEGENIDLTADDVTYAMNELVRLSA